MAQCLRHFLIAGDLGLIHHQHNNRAERNRRFRADVREGGLQARDANGEAGRWNLLPGEAGNEIVIAPAAADGAKAHRLAIVAFDLERQLGLKYGTGVIFETADCL